MPVDGRWDLIRRLRVKFIGFNIQYYCRIQTTSTQQQQCSSRHQCSNYSDTGRFILGNCNLVTWVASSTMIGGTALQTGRSRVRFPIVSLEFFIDVILPAALWPWSSLSP
jgi:hypothetical protein